MHLADHLLIRKSEVCAEGMAQEGGRPNAESRAHAQPAKSRRLS